METPDFPPNVLHPEAMASKPTDISVDDTPTHHISRI